MAYNPYSAINAIYNLKNTWDSANTAGDNAKKNKAAENAQVFYNQLKNNGYGDVAKELSAVDASGAKYILDQYSNKNSDVDNLAFNTSMQGAVDKNNKLAGYVDSDRKDVQGQYHNLINYANSDVINTDVTKTDAYKSTYDKMMAKYDLSALQGRNNAVASGGASNGGNIDSYAAANAMRQQAALTAQGQVIAHQAGIDAYKAGLDAYNARVSNVANILNQLGVYNKGTYDEMNKTIANDRDIAQQYFTNSETAKNNEVARLVEQAKITGNVPLSWIINNDPIYSEFLNEDGTFKKEKEGTDIQALINRYKALGDTETAEKLAAVRAGKINGNDSEFGKYLNEGDLASIKNALTEAARQFNMTDATTRYGYDKEVELGKYGYDTEKEISKDTNATTKYGYDTEKEIAKDTNATTKYGYDTEERIAKDTNATTKYGYDTEERIAKDTNATTRYGYDTEESMNTANNQNTMDQLKVVNSSGSNIEVDKNGNVKVKSDSTADGSEWTKFTSYFTDENISNFLNQKLKPYYDNGVALDQATLENLIVGKDVLNSNSTTYDIDVEEAREIIKNLNILLKAQNPNAEPYDDSFLDNYTNRTVFNSKKGMKEK